VTKKQTLATTEPKRRTNGDRRKAALLLTARTRTRALNVPLASNAVLVIVKLAVWLASGSISVLSEAVHSAADLLVTSFQVISVRLAARPADDDHAYGHGKYENVSAGIEAVIILLTAGFVVSQALVRLRDAPNGRVLEVLKEGTTVTAVGDPNQEAANNTWVHVHTAKGTDGWVAGQYLALCGAQVLAASLTTPERRRCQMCRPA